MNLTFSPQISSRLQKYLPLGVSLLIALLIGLQLAKLAWMMVPAPEQGLWVPRPAEPATRNNNQAQKSGIKLEQIQSAKLFGDFKAQETIVEVAAEDAPDTQLRLKLRGIVMMENPSLSRALIEPSNGELLSFATGMNVPGGAKIHRIHADRVLLKRAGRLETLRLEKEQVLDTGITTTKATSSARSVGSAPRIIDSGTAAKLSGIREELLNDPSKASQYLRIQPARANGAMKGYRIYPGRKRELFKEAGLRPGDIVTSVNGVALDDPGKGFQLLGDLSSAQQLNLQIERGGQTQSLSVNLN